MRIVQTIRALTLVAALAAPLTPALADQPAQQANATVQTSNGTGPYDAAQLPGP